MEASESSPEASVPGKKAGKLAGIDPAELLARAMNTVDPSAGAGPWTPPTVDELAALLPQYGITALLGSGGMGAVYRGVQSTLDRPVAIKLLPAEMAAESEFVDRFRREARTLAKLQHSGIVAVHDFGQTSAGHPYFVMEYVEGTDLQRILRGPGLDPVQALSLISQICDALHYAHRQDVIHRDIKPANILVTPDGRAKVADFGLARPFKEDTSNLTSAKAVMGTDAYMAPEQRTGHADQRADIYALGVMLYEMLTGQRPHGVFDPPSRKVQIDIRLDEVVLKALQEEPERRYQQAGEMKTDVDLIRTTPPQRQPAQKSKSKVPAVIAACLTLSIAAGFVIWKKANQPGKAERVEEARQSSPALQRVEPSVATGRPDGLKPSTTLAAATKDTPFVNSLGMQFVPVPRTSVLFCIWETRVHDYAEYARTNTVSDRWRLQEQDGLPVSRESNYPVVGVSWSDAKAFCKWLTQKETANGVIPNGATYRLPTDVEWSSAIGVYDEQGNSPAEREHNPSGYHWGSNFPPPRNTIGNYADESYKAKFQSEGSIQGYSDGFATTAPVGSFAPNPLGLYDLSGNVWEWCEDYCDPLPAESGYRVLRGASWTDAYPESFLLSDRHGGQLHHLSINTGFRCVLDRTVQVAADNDRKGMAVGPAVRVQTDPDHQRHLAVSVISKGGEVAIWEGEETKPISRSEDLPQRRIELAHVDQTRGDFTDADSGLLVGCQKLRSLRLHGCSMSFIPFESLPALQSVELTGSSRMTFIAFKDLPKCGNLSAIILVEPAIDGRITRILAQCQALDKIGLDCAKIANADLLPLADLKRLRTLEFGVQGGQGITTEEGLEVLARMEQLKHLFLVGFNLPEGKLSFLPQMKNVTSLLLRYCNLPKEAYTSIAVMPALESLEVWGSDGRSLLNITDDDLHAVLGNKLLERITFVHTRITAEGFAEMLPLPRMRYVSIDGNAGWVSDAGVNAMLKACPNIEHLNLQAPRLTADAAAVIAATRSLRALGLRGAKGLDQFWFTHLASMKGLTFLDLSDSPLTDSHVSSLENLKSSLTELRAANTLITDVSVETLKKFTALRVLEIVGTEITKQGAETLRQALPACEVRF